MKTYRFTGTTLSPVTIGAGEEIEPFDYLINQGTFYRISLEDVIADFSGEDRGKFYTIIESGNIDNLRKFISNRVDLEKHALFSCRVSDEVERIYKNKFDDIQNQLLITSFIRNKIDFKPFLPGSSLKGSMRTAVLNEMAKTMGRNKIMKERNLEKKIEAVILESQNRKGFLEGKNDPFRAVKIRDITLPGDATIIAQIKNMAKNRRGRLSARRMQLFYEVLKSKLFGGELTFSGEIMIDKDLQEKGRRGVSKKITIDMIKDSCNSFYRDKMEMEHNKFYHGSFLDSNSRVLLDEQIDNGSFILRVGRYSGVESVTLDEYRKPKPPGRNRGKWGNTRNVCEEQYPMGWIKISLI